MAFCYLLLESFCLVSVGCCEDNVVPADERLAVQGADVVFPGVLGGLGEEEGFWGLVGVGVVVHNFFPRIITFRYIFDVNSFISSLIHINHQIIVTIYLFTYPSYLATNTPREIFWLINIRASSIKVQLKYTINTSKIKYPPNAKLSNFSFNLNHRIHSNALSSAAFRISL